MQPMTLQYKIMITVDVLVIRYCDEYIHWILVSSKIKYLYGPFQ